MSRHHKILGVGEDASESEIRAAFRKKAMLWHPDKNPGDEDAARKFREAKDAYDALTKHLEGSSGQTGDGMSSAFTSAFADMFSSEPPSAKGTRKRGGGKSYHRNPKENGADVNCSIPISLEAAFHGKRGKVSYKAMVACGTCMGGGFVDGSGGTAICETCEGTGSCEGTKGRFTVSHKCSDCSGTGRADGGICPDCRGEGCFKGTMETEVQIPVGARDGDVVLVKGRGDAGVRGGEPGDLRVTIRIKKHPNFERDGNDLMCPAACSASTAALGGTARIALIEGGSVAVKVPAGSQHGRKLRISGKGMPTDSGARGDLFGVVTVMIPTELSERERALYEKLAELESRKGDK